MPASIWDYLLAPPSSSFVANPDPPDPPDDPDPPDPPEDPDPPDPDDPDPPDPDDPDPPDPEPEPDPPDPDDSYVVGSLSGRGMDADNSGYVYINLEAHMNDWSGNQNFGTDQAAWAEWWEELTTLVVSEGAPVWFGEIANLDPWPRKATIIWLRKPKNGTKPYRVFA